jgi:hypothetical protein
MKFHFCSLSLIGIMVLFAIVISGCGFQHSAATFAIIDPSNRTTYSLGSTITIRFASNIPQDPTINRYQLQIFDNGSMVVDRIYPSFSGPTLYVPLPQPELAGGHILFANARAVFVNGTMSDWYRTQQICVFVGPPTTTSCDQSAQPLTIAPTITPTPNPMIANTQAYPSQIYYGPACPASLSTLTFRAALMLPNGTTSDQWLVNTHISVRVGSSGASSGSLLLPLLSNGTWDTASGGQVFIGALSLTHSYNDANNQLDIASLGTSSGAILWYVTISENNASGQNTELERSSNQVVSLAPCPASGGVLPHNSNKGSNGATGCGQYTNQTSCDLAGCSWNPSGSSCTVTP